MNEISCIKIETHSRHPFKFKLLQYEYEHRDLADANEIKQYCAGLTWNKAEQDSAKIWKYKIFDLDF